MSLLIYPITETFPILAFTTQCEGGVSTGQFTSFNLGRYSGDSGKNVEANFGVLANLISVAKDRIVTPYQTHEDKIVNVSADFLSLSSSFQNDQLQGVDALITDQKQICIGVTTADCVPLLIYDPTNHVAGAVHSGWKSTMKHIVSKTITEMTNVFGSKPKDLQVMIGPCISSQAFEVGEEVLAQFEGNDFRTQEFTKFDTVTGKPHIDLRLANMQLLLRSGVDLSNIYVEPTCTFSSSLYFSARRQGFASGRMLTGICLR